MTALPRRAEPYLIHGALALAAVIALFPLAWMISVSVMAPGEAASSPPPLVPASPTLASYRELFSRAAIGRHLANSVGLALAATALSLAFNVTAGYAFAKLRFTGRDLIWKGVVGVMLVPAQVAMIPVFLLLKQVGLVNTYAGVLLPSLASASGIFLIRQYARSIPDELLEAARIDGAGELRIFRSIVLPVLGPVLVTLAMFAFLGSWNDFLWPLIVITSTDQSTVQLGLASFQGAHVTKWNLLMAGNVMALAPMLIVFVGAQRWFVRSLATTGIR